MEAHAVVPGTSDYIAGFLHPFLTPPHLLVLVSLGLFLGQHPLRPLVPAAGVFAMAAALGILATCVHAVTGVPPVVLIVLGLCIGGLVASAAFDKAWMRLAACAATGLALGLDSGVDPGVAGPGMAKTLGATWAGLTLGVVNVAHYSAQLPARRWVQTGVRIVGAWSVAVGILMLAFALRR